MSNAIRNMIPAFSHPAGASSELSAVGPRPQRARRPKLFYAFIAMFIVMGTILAQILLSVMTSSSAYEIDELQASNKAISRTYEQAQQKVAELSSPQNIALAAEHLGMVISANPAYLRLSDSKVIGHPMRATSRGALLRGANARLVPNAQLAAAGATAPSVAGNTLVNSVAGASAAAGSVALPATANTIPAPQTR